MSSAGNRRLLAEQRRQKTMKDRTAKWWQSRTPCTCLRCQLKAAIARGDVRVAGDPADMAEFAMAPHGGESAKH